MTDTNALAPLREHEYEAIEAAVMETARGRWFLSEYARRNRVADTNILLDSLSRIENLIKDERASEPASPQASTQSGATTDKIRADIADMAAAIERAKAEIAQIKPANEQGDHFSDATSELDAIVSQTEKATSSILEAAESIQETAWTMRENGADDAQCDEIDAKATDIYMACSFQDITGQRTQKVVKVLGYLEKRISAMLNILALNGDPADKAEPFAFDAGDERPDAHLLHGPQDEDLAPDQVDIDSLFDSVPLEDNLQTTDNAAADDVESATSAHDIVDIDVVPVAADIADEPDLSIPVEIDVIQEDVTFEVTDEAEQIPETDEVLALADTVDEAPIIDEAAADATADALPSDDDAWTIETSDIAETTADLQPDIQAESDGTEETKWAEDNAREMAEMARDALDETGENVFDVDMDIEENLLDDPTSTLSPAEKVARFS